MSKKLKNVKAVKEMIAGTHKSQTKTTIGFGETKSFVKRTVGETWTDDEGNTWEQKKGYKVKLGKLSKLRDDLTKFPKCDKDVCTCTNPKRNDFKMRAIHGKCFDCVIDMEHQLRIEGKYEEYEHQKMLENGKAWLKQAKLEKEALKSAMRARFVNEDGSLEEWEGMSWSELEEKIDNEFEIFKNNFIAKLETKDE